MLCLFDSLGLTQARQKAVEFALDEAVAFACTCFEAGAVEHLDVAAAVMNQAFVVQLAGCFGNAFAAHAEHVGDQLLGHGQIVRGDAIHFDQQPASCTTKA
jgi:hypothetical protein